MPQTQSAKKSLRNSRRKAKRNTARRNLLKQALLKVKKNLNQRNYLTAQKMIDKMAGKGLIHRNKAARLKSRLVKKIKE